MEENKPEILAQVGLQQTPQLNSVILETPPEAPQEVPKEPPLESVQVPKQPEKRPFWLILGASGFWIIVFIYWHGLNKVKSHPLPQPLPTEMVLKGSVYKVQKAIHRLFKTYPIKIFQNQPNDPLLLTLYWKGDHHPDKVRIFRNPVNENDVYVSCNDMPICKSTVYTNGWGKPLEYLADFQLHIIPQGAKETLVKVIMVNSEVIAGKRFGFGSCGPGMGNVYVKVDPTSVEEGEIISALQQILKKDHSAK